jgi:fibronectin-binding autotransporter adhesin
MRCLASLLVGLAVLTSSASATVIVGADNDASSTVKLLAGTTSAELASFAAYPAASPGGVRVAGGDVNGDGVSDVITGVAGAANGHVKVFDGVSGGEIRSFFAYAGGTPDGVFVGAGRINADAAFDIITGVEAGSASHVKVFDGASGAEIRSFFAYPPTFLGGVRVAGGDVSGDGVDDIVTGAGNGGFGHVKVFDGSTGAEVRSFFAFGPNFSGGVYVAAGDLNGDGRADIVAGADAGAGPQVNIFDGASGLSLGSFFAYAPTFSGGVRVAVGDVNGDGSAEIVTGAGAAGAGHVKVFSGATLTEMSSYLAFGSGYSGGVYVGASRLAVPEPASAMLLMTAFALLIRRRNGHCR